MYPTCHSPNPLNPVTAANFWRSKADTLLKVDLAVDLNNDGQIDHADRSLQSAGEKTEASPREIKLATEYIFDNDSISNGLWDKDSSAAPSNVTEDDDAEAIQISLNGLNSGAIWLEHPGINLLKFYSSKEFKEDDEIVFPFDLTQDNSVFENPIYAKLTWPADWIINQGNGELVLKFGKLDKTEAVSVSKVRFNLIRGYGAEDYFNAVRDYIYEKNTEKYLDAKSYGSTYYAMVVFSEELSSMRPFSAFDYSNNTPLANRVSEVVSLHPDSEIVINGNFQYDPASGSGAGMYRRCIGEFVLNSNLIMPPTDLRLSDPAPQWGYLGYDSISSGYSFLEGRQMNSATANVPTEHGMGGLHLNYASSNRDAPGALIGLFEEPQFPEHDRLIFIMMNPYLSGLGTTNARHAEAAVDAAQSRVPELSPGGPRNLFILDGGGSLAMAVEDPSGTMIYPVQAPRHFPFAPTKVNTYLTFEVNKPR